MAFIRIEVAVFVALCVCGYTQAQSSRVVTIRQGSVRGYRVGREDYFSFNNIPYATAPTGKNRFTAPLPPPSWTGIRDGVNRNIVCPQASSLIQNLTVSMTPDCLVANVHVPDTTENNLAVVVFIHGGGFVSGNGVTNFPGTLMFTKKIIVVTFNYRLGTHGFLCLGTPSAPGNAGLKDQLALLRWVRDNIASFGGNPNDVTIEGCSAGGVSVDLLMLSKAAEGLFHKAIPASGANAMWALQTDPIANAKEFAEYHGFNNVDDLEALEEFYISSSFRTLFDIPTPTLDQNFFFVPCVEKDVGVERFFDEAPISILKKGNFRKLPVLYGFTDMEGLVRVWEGYRMYKNAMNNNFGDVLPHDLQFESKEEKREVGRRVKEFYFGDKPVGDETIDAYIYYFTDIMFIYPVLRSATMQVEAGNRQVYLYEYNFTDRNAILPPTIDATVRGVFHCIQSALVHDDSLNNIGSNELRRMSGFLRELWFNFMITGHPTPPGSTLPPWQPMNANRSPHMELTFPPVTRGELYSERYRLWDEIYSKYYRMPIPPTH